MAGIRRHDYMPFGEELFAGTGNRTAAGGYVADSVRQKFTEKERDNETGLDYFLARYYSSTQGRFTSVDPENYQAMRNLTNPQSWNAYAYVNNNPLQRIDPDGRGFFSKLGNWLKWGVWGEEADVKAEEAARRIAVLTFTQQKQLGDGRYYFSSGSPNGPLQYIDVSTASREQIWRAYESLSNPGDTFTQDDVDNLLKNLPSLAGANQPQPTPTPANERVFGQDGTQITSKTVWRGKGKERIDVENPNPGQRPGQIHYQDNAGNKYLYDPASNTFRGAPNSVNRLLNEPQVQAAINKAMRFLGEQ